MLDNREYLKELDEYAIVATAKKRLYPSGTQSESPRASPLGLSLG